MPSYLITDNVTGKKFKVTGDSPPTEQEAAKIFADFTAPPSEYVGDKSGRNVSDMQKEFIAREGKPQSTILSMARPVLQGTGAALGGIAGATGGAVAGLGVGSIPGAVTGGVLGSGLGYGIGTKLSDMMETATGTAQSRPQPPTVVGQLGQSLSDIGTGATYEMGGQATVPALKLAAKGVGAVVKPVMGRLSGTGTGAINESIASGMKPTSSMNPLASTTTYDKALRGEITGDEIVDSARTALNKLKSNRASAYQTELKAIEQNIQPVDMRPVKQELSDLMASYNVKVDPATGALDMSRIAMGKSGRNDIQEIVETVSAWGSKSGDNTPIGLDTLKRQLDDFYSDSSQARQFVSTIRNKVKDTIVKAVPEYDNMTKGYSEATKLIKDVEAGLMTRKQGMTGRITSDQTLRRLMSSMKDNFALRKELVDVLGRESGEDLGGAIAGYTQNSIVPLGMQGNIASTAAAGTLAKMLDPAWASIILASSPRVQGEFFRMLGKGMKTANTINNALPTKDIIRQTAIQSQGEQP